MYVVVDVQLSLKKSNPFKLPEGTLEPAQPERQEARLLAPSRSRLLAPAVDGRTSQLADGSCHCCCPADAAAVAAALLLLLLLVLFVLKKHREAQVKREK